jgi:uncharacterized protein YbjT (DUF2867 family)
MILVTGATGNIGRELCQLLANDNVPARAMCRREEQVATYTQMGLHAVIGDFDDPESLRQAMQGCDRFFLLSPPDPQQVQREKQTIDLAVEAGIRHIVKVSAADSNLTARVPWARAHAEIDHYLRSKSVGWTILRPSGFMQNFIESAMALSMGVLPHIMGNGQTSYIDLRDVALVARHVLTETTHHGAIYYLTGPESLSTSDIVSHLSIALELPIRETPLSVDQMHRAMMASELGDWLSNALLAQYAVIAGGYSIDTTEEVKRLTGQEPRTFAEFAQMYKYDLGAI